MSSSLARLAQTTSVERRTNGDEAVLAQESDDTAPQEAEVQPEAPVAADVRQGDVLMSSRPEVSYPFDENLFDSSAPVHQQQAIEHSNEGIEDDEPTQEHLAYPLDLKPFFTLIEDPQTGEHHHPTVHYMFSDDDPEILTAALLDALSQAHGDRQADDRKSEERSERYVIVDMASNGKTSTSAFSLSPEWQVVATSITQAPSWGEHSNDNDGGLMLRISGQQSGKQGAVKQSREQQGQAGNIDDLVNTYHERLRHLDDVLGRFRMNE